MFLQKPMLGTQIDRSDSLNNPVLDLLFNEGHGDRVNDLSGWGNNGTLHGFDFPSSRTSGWNIGQDGVALTFDGIDDYIKVPNSDSLSITDVLTIDVTIKTADDSSMAIIGKHYGEYELDIYAGYGNGAFSMYYGDNTTYKELKWLNIGNYADNQMHTIICTLVKTMGSGELFIDGNSKGSQTNDPLPGNGTNDLYIGTRKNGIHPFNGTITRARILPRAMSAFEVMQTQINPYGVYLQ